MTDSTADWDLYSTPLQGAVKTHGGNACAGRSCCVHNPSDHHMKEWPLVFNRNKGYMGERICDHDYRHPDPDAHAYVTSRLPKHLAQTIGVHTCCGCCILSVFLENQDGEPSS